ncbi:aminotransferase class I and II [Paenibacillus curdlanolyticus YK9]|uniref:Aminotransferase n=1 Tax=Paenibacillus curdlanolyticus YK9 TaxID=717606 RepID=E0I6E0_9BACL|nr:LL-diaminopimelate aminotransferase [Paenibacillus curdlanolyticus]EFM11606.1 aminotransferase class I and II [Paenibacillus curdlanolyticus YK9]
MSVITQSTIQNAFANRIGGSTFGLDTKVYKFEKIKRAKNEAKAKFPDRELIDMGLGEPDWMADPAVVQVLAEEAAKRDNRFYSDNGMSEFKEAAAHYLQEVFGITGMNAATEINHCIGSKSALSQIPLMFINPGDILLMTTPGYPVMATHTQWLGGEVVHLPLTKANNYLPDLSALSEDVRKRAKLLYINYPNNPTGATATREFYESVVEFCQANQIIVVSDEAYAALTFEGEQPLSFLSVPGAKEIGVSIHSLSKSFNMTGWRLGFVAGNELVVKAFAHVKDNCDSGQFIPIQKAGVYCLNHPELTVLTGQKYSRRHGKLVEALNRVGFNARKPKAAFFLYVEIPKGIAGGPEFTSAEQFSEYLIREQLISTVPWDEVGANVRFSVTFVADSEEEEDRIIHEIEERLSSIPFIWE